MTNFLQKLFNNTTTRRGIGAIIIFVILWHMDRSLMSGPDTICLALASCRRPDMFLQPFLKSYRCMVTG